MFFIISVSLQNDPMDSFLQLDIQFVYFDEWILYEILLFQYRFWTRVSFISFYTLL